MLYRMQNRTALSLLMKSTRSRQAPDIAVVQMYPEKVCSVIFLPIVEGSVINTKHGPVKTDHILFIGAGAFHTAKPTDLIPELQGRFPIRVELENLDKETFVKILTVPENALLKQHKALLETEGIEIEFTEEAIDEIATMAFLMNEQTENIGARRLHTILEKLLEDISFNIPDMEEEKIVIDQDYVKEKFAERFTQEDIDRYIL